MFEKNMLDLDSEDDLPWDPLWQYVLGEDDDDDASRQRSWRSRSSSFNRYRSDDAYVDHFDWLTEDAILSEPKEMTRQSSTNSASEQPQLKRRLSFTRPSSFTRQTSNQSASTAGSNSSFRIRGLLKRGKKVEEKDDKSTQASDFLSSFAPALSNSDDESRDDNAASESKERFRFRKKKEDNLSYIEEDTTIFEAITGGFDEIGGQSQEVVASLPKKEKRKLKLFRRKKDDRATEVVDSTDSILVATMPSLRPKEDASEEATRSPKREKRNRFGKKKEEKDAPPITAASFLASISEGFVDETDNSNQSREKGIHLDREKRKSSWKRTSSKTQDDDRSDLESIDAMLGPWEGKRETQSLERDKPESQTTEQNKGKRESKSTTNENKTLKGSKRPLKSVLKKSSESSISPPVASWANWTSDSPELVAPKATAQRNPLLKAVTKLGGQSSNKQSRKGATEDRSAQEGKRSIMCGPRVTEDTTPFYNNPVFLSSFSEDSGSQDSGVKKNNNSMRKRSSRSTNNKALLNQSDEGIDIATNSFLPHALLPWSNEIGIQNSDSTESTKLSADKSMTAASFNPTNSTISAASVSVNSSVSGFSEQGQSKKSVKWADEVNSSDQESAQGAVSFAEIRKVLDPSWLYAVSSSDSDSSMTSSANRSSQSGDLSSVPTDSDVSMSGVSSSDKGDSDKEDQPEIRLRFTPGGFQDRFSQLPPIDENESFRGSLGEDGQETFETNHAINETGNSFSESGASNSIVETDDEPVHKTISVIQRKNGAQGEMTTIKPQVSQFKLKDTKSSTSRSLDIEALILGGMNTQQESRSNSEKESETRIESMSLARDVEETNQQKVSHCSFNIPKRSQNRGLDPRLPLCRVLRRLSDDELVRVMESGLPIHELTVEELAEIFPKLRMVADERSNDQSSLVLGNTNSFDDSRPALLQVPSKALKPAFGLQSLYEYDFTSGKHMSASYDACGNDSIASISVVTHDEPPAISEPNFAVIQVEVCFAKLSPAVLSCTCIL